MPLLSPFGVPATTDHRFVRASRPLADRITPQAGPLTRSVVTPFRRPRVTLEAAAWAHRGAGGEPVRAAVDRRPGLGRVERHGPGRRP